VRLLALNAVLLVLVGVAVPGVTVVSRAEASVEALVRRYSFAVTSSSLEDVLADIAPAERETWRAWLATQLGNVYEVRGIAVRSHPLWQRALRLAPAGPLEVTVVLDVNRGFPGEYYQATTTQAVVQVDGVWYLQQPLLAQ
jgi:hypothetical protein